MARNNQLEMQLLEMLMNKAIPVLIQGFNDLLKKSEDPNSDVNRVDIEDSLKEIYLNIKTFAEEKNLTPEQMITIESNKIEVLKLLGKEARWKDKKKYIEFVLLILGVGVAAVAGLALVLNNISRDDIPEICGNTIDLIKE